MWYNKKIVMENSLKDNPNIPKRFARLIEKRSSPELDSLEGVFLRRSGF